MNDGTRRRALGKTHILETWGDFAVFTSAVKVERWSHPCMTPSAARGILDCIYVKPTKFRWAIERIEILRPIETIALMRNEVKDKGPSESEVRAWMANPAKATPLLADATDSEGKGRTQRQTMALRDVRYRIHARIAPWPDASEPVVAYDEQFERRAKRGQNVMQPAFGCREFPAFWRLIDYDEAQPDPYPVDLDCGWMLYDVWDLSRPGSDRDPARVSLFRAEIRGGVLEIPPYESDAVRKGLPREVRR